MNIRTQRDRREAGRKILNFYFPEGYIGANIDQLLQYTSDDRFVRPIQKTVQLISKYTPIYFYLFSYSSDYGIKTLHKLIRDSRLTSGVSHLEEQFYMWKRHDLEDLNPTGFDKLIARRLMRIWSNFIKTRNPTPFRDQLLQEYIWPTVTSQSNITYMQIDKNLSLQQNYRHKQMEFWESVYDTYGHPPFLTY
ncbi:unnamed protein product [Psylliodes chrysocephalus]|uniref:Carboxylesterase type B domain-containing protein n=1 Tax=Psylliodes chrysocephalus TaxID=3402493 RepID=A0A9P0G5J9_9CUCU|nr:unnamed protein product [Psylliodes chrysocephala]